MTAVELVKQVVRGNTLLVGEYRGSHAEVAGYVDKKTGQAISYVRGIHLVECDWYGRINRAESERTARTEQTCTANRSE